MTNDVWMQKDCHHLWLPFLTFFEKYIERVDLVK